MIVLNFSLTYSKILFWSRGNVLILGLLHFCILKCVKKICWQYLLLLKQFTEIAFVLSIYRNSFCFVNLQKQLLFCQFTETAFVVSIYRNSFCFVNLQKQLLFCQFRNIQTLELFTVYYKSVLYNYINCMYKFIFQFC